MLHKALELTLWCINFVFVCQRPLLSVNQSMSLLGNHHEKQKGTSDTWSRMALAFALVTLLRLPLRSERMLLSDCMRAAVNFGLEVPEPLRAGVSEVALRRDPGFFRLTLLHDFKLAASQALTICYWQACMQVKRQAGAAIAIFFSLCVEVAQSR